MVDGVHFSEVRSKTGNQRLFQHSAAISGVEFSGDEIRSPVRSGEPSSDRILGQTPQN